MRVITSGRMGLTNTTLTFRKLGLTHRFAIGIKFNVPIDNLRKTNITLTFRRRAQTHRFATENLNNVSIDYPRKTDT